MMDVVIISGCTLLVCKVVTSSLMLHPLAVLMMPYSLFERKLRLQIQCFFADGLFDNINPAIWVQELSPSFEDVTTRKCT